MSAQLRQCHGHDRGGGGAGGGDLSGTYPAPEIGAGRVGTDEVDASLTAADIADTGTLGTAEINESNVFNDNSLDNGDIANTSSLGTAEI